MDRLRLVALDEQDLAVVSAHAQDAVTRVGDLRWLAGERRFLLSMNRFAWERLGGAGGRRTGERRRAVLSFDRVAAARASGIARNDATTVLSLLAITFEPGEAPAGTVVLTFSGGGELRLSVECIEARIADVGGAWEAVRRPVHLGTERG